MRHWTAGWLKRERSALFKRLPWSYALGQRLPQGAAVSVAQGSKNALLSA